MTRKKYDADDVVDYPSSSSEDESEEEYESPYDEDVAWDNLSRFIHQPENPNWLKNYIDPSFMLDLILSGNYAEKPLRHLMLKSETLEDLTHFLYLINEMVTICGFRCNQSQLKGMLYSMLSERAKYLVVG